MMEKDREDWTGQSLKNGETELIITKVWGEVKKRCSKEEIDWYAVRK